MTGEGGSNDGGTRRGGRGPGRGAGSGAGRGAGPARGAAPRGHHGDRGRQEGEAGRERRSAAPGSPPRGRADRSGPAQTGAEVRASACHVLNAVLAHGKNLDEALAWNLQRRRLAPRDSALLKALCYGVLRHYRRLGWQAQQMMDRPLQGAPLVDLLLRLGLLQMLDLRIPDHAATAATASAADLLDAAWARPLVNAVLRRAQREPERLQPPADDPACRHSFPDWLAEALARDWGEQAEKLMAASNVQAPMTLRVHHRRMSADDYVRRLQAAGIDARSLPGAGDAVVLDSPLDVAALPGFARGSVSVQDASAQLAAELLDARPGQRVLDACAAPGGKSAHLLERTPDLRLTAVDSDGARLARVDETLRRIGGKARLVCADAAATGRWWQGEPFDRILIDAPCSGTGVIRRHPDIKWLRRASDLPVLAEQQLLLLQSLWPLLAPGGLLVFATCSVLRAEGAQPVAAFLEQTPDAEADALSLPVGAADGAGWRIAPDGDWDGFFYARLRRRGG